MSEQLPLTRMQIVLSAHERAEAMQAQGHLLELNGEPDIEAIRAQLGSEDLSDIPSPSIQALTRNYEAAAETVAWIIEPELEAPKPVLDAEDRVVKVRHRDPESINKLANRAVAFIAERYLTDEQRELNENRQVVYVKVDQDRRRSNNAKPNLHEPHKIGVKPHENATLKGLIRNPNQGDQEA